MNRLLTSQEIDLAIKNLAAKRSPGPDGFTDEFHQTFKKLTSILLKLFQKWKRREHFLINLQNQHHHNTKAKQGHKKTADKYKSLL